MKLIHETHPAIALSVLRSGKFVAGPILGDAGLNACIVNHPKGEYHPDQAANCGAILEFEWTGPVSTQGYSGYPSMNVCYDQHPHRAFVFVGTTQHLNLTGLTLLTPNGWDSVVKRPVFSLANAWAWLKSWRIEWTPPTP